MKRLFLLTLGLVAVGAFVAWYQAMFIDPDFTERSLSEWGPLSRMLATH